MLKLAEISDQIGKIQSGELSVDEFENWFRRASRNFHAYSDQNAQMAILEVENVLSAYHFDGLDDASSASELANAIGPFVNRQLRQKFEPV